MVEVTQAENHPGEIKGLRDELAAAELHIETLQSELAAKDAEIERLRGALLYIHETSDDAESSRKALEALGDSHV